MFRPSSLKALCKIGGAVFIGLILMKVIWVLYFKVVGEKLILNEERTDLLTRRAYLINRIKKLEKVEQMHGALPPLFRGEWAVGTYSMFAASLTNMSYLYPETRNESVEIIDHLIQRVLTKEYSRFDTVQWGEHAFDSLDRDHGHIGYLGHLNFMLAAHAALGSVKYKDLFTQISSSLKQKMMASASLNAGTYPNEFYIPDNVVVVAGLRLHDLFVRRDPDNFPNQWMAHAKKHLRDPKTGLLVHRINKNGIPTVYTRGCSTGWNSFYLPFVDEAFAKEQYKLLKKHLGKRLLCGFEGIREYPAGITGSGDIDSGPVIFELSTSGTGFAVAGAKFHEDEKFLDSLLLTAEVAGGSIQSKGERRYLFAPLVGEAIMLAMRSATRWDRRFINEM